MRLVDKICKYTEKALAIAGLTGLIWGANALLPDTSSKVHADTETRISHGNYKYHNQFGEYLGRKEESRDGTSKVITYFNSKDEEYKEEVFGIDGGLDITEQLTKDTYSITKKDNEGIQSIKYYEGTVSSKSSGKEIKSVEDFEEKKCGYVGKVMKDGRQIAYRWFQNNSDANNYEDYKGDSWSNIKKPKSFIGGGKLEAKADGSFTKSIEEIVNNKRTIKSFDYNFDKFGIFTGYEFVERDALVNSNYYNKSTETGNNTFDWAKIKNQKVTKKLKKKGGTNTADVILTLDEKTQLSDGRDIKTKYVDITRGEFPIAQIKSLDLSRQKWTKLEAIVKMDGVDIENWEYDILGPSKIVDTKNEFTYVITAKSTSSYFIFNKYKGIGEPKKENLVAGFVIDSINSRAFEDIDIHITKSEVSKTQDVRKKDITCKRLHIDRDKQNFSIKNIELYDMTGLTSQKIRELSEEETLNLTGAIKLLMPTAFFDDTQIEDMGTDNPQDYTTLEEAKFTDATDFLEKIIGFN